MRSRVALFSFFLICGTFFGAHGSVLETPAYSDAISKGLIEDPEYAVFEETEGNVREGDESLAAETESDSVSAYDRNFIADSVFLSARKAYAKRHLQALNELSSQALGHPLHGYIELWQLLLALESNPSDVALTQKLLSFIEAHEDSYLAERARADWARFYIEHGNPAGFNRLWTKLDWQKTEPDMLCHKAYADLSSGQTPARLDAAKDTLTRTSTPTIEACKRLGKLVLDRDPSWTWNYIQVLLQQRRYAHAKRVLTSATGKLGFNKATAIEIINRPAAWFKRNAKKLHRIPVRLKLIAALCLAPKNENDAATVAFSMKNLHPQTKTLLWAQIGLNAALNRNNKAVDYYRLATSRLVQAKQCVGLENILQWQLRAALMQENWTELLTCLSRAPKNLAKSPCWTFWKGFALIQTNKAAQGKAFLRTLIKNTDFYGFLACDVLSVDYPNENIKAPKLSREQQIAFDQNPHLLRANAFYDLHLTYEGNREWNWALRSMDKPTRLALALYALQKGLVHRAINTSTSTGLYCAELNYPLAYGKMIDHACLETGLPTDWVLGLIRQESRFITTAKSSAGALGLMQLMPKTARWIVKNDNLGKHVLKDLLCPENNILIGTRYLKLVYDNFSRSVPLATASYNAGPTRVQQWRQSLVKPLTGAIFAETIPFTETRNYVKAVTANRVHYARILGRPVRLTDILGIVEKNSDVNPAIP